MDLSQSVTVAFKYGLDDDLEALNALSEELEVVIEKEAVGELDGHEVAVDLSTGELFMYGPNAERLFKAVHPVLKAAPFMAGATATLQFGEGEDANEITVEV